MKDNFSRKVFNYEEEIFTNGMLVYKEKRSSHNGGIFKMKYSNNVVVSAVFTSFATYDDKNILFNGNHYNWLADESLNIKVGDLIAVDTIRGIQSAIVTNVVDELYADYEPNKEVVQVLYRVEPNPSPFANTRFANERYWISKDGTKTKIKDLELGHLFNIIKMFDDVLKLVDYLDFDGIDIPYNRIVEMCKTTPIYNNLVLEYMKRVGMPKKRLTKLIERGYFI